MCSDVHMEISPQVLYNRVTYRARDRAGWRYTMQDIFRVKNALTRSISPENRTGEPGKGGATPL